MKVYLRNNPLFTPDNNNVVTNGGLNKRAVLVYQGTFQSMDGEVQITPAKMKKLVSNHNARLNSLSQRYQGEVPIHAYPPIQLDHSTSARDTIGRLVGKVELGDYTLENGEVVPAVYGNACVLGADNIERVEDGRWSQLSIGADLDSGELVELSVTPFNAAKSATLLSSQITKEPDVMLVNKAELSAWLQKTENLTAADANARLAKMSEDQLKKLAKKKMEDDDKEDDKSNLSDENTEGTGDDKKELGDKDNDDDKEKDKKDDKDGDDVNVNVEAKGKKKLADGDDDDKQTRLARSRVRLARSRLADINKTFGETITKAKLASRKTTIHNRIAKLKSEAKISPAEVKKIDITELAGKDQQVIDAVLQTYENREPVIQPGVYGTTKADNVSSIYQKRQQSQLEEETRANMSLLRKTVNNGDKDQAGQQPQGMRRLSSAPYMDQKPEPIDHNEFLTEISRLIDEGKGDEAKSRLASALAAGSVNVDPQGVDSGAELTRLSEAVTTLENQFNELSSMTSEFLGNA